MEPKRSVLNAAVKDEYDALAAKVRELLANILTTPSETPQALNTYRICFVRSDSDGDVARSLRRVLVVAPDRVRAVALFAGHSDAIGDMLLGYMLNALYIDILCNRPYTIPSCKVIARLVDNLFREDCDDGWWFEETVDAGPELIECRGYGPRVKAAGRE